MQPARLGAWKLCLASTALFELLVLALPCNAQTVETYQQTNDRIRALSAASHAVPSRDYVIGSGDLLALQVFDVQELSREVRVSQTGTIAIPLVPVRLHVSGLTEMQAQIKIAEVLEANGLVSHPDVSVAVKEKKSRPITIVGAVPHPMVYQADRQVRLIDVLAAAGGINPDAGDHVIVTRPERDPSSDPSQIAGTSTDAAAPALAQDSGPQAAASTPPSDLPQAPPPVLANTITVSLNQMLEAGDM